MKREDTVKEQAAVQKAASGARAATKAKVRSAVKAVKAAKAAAKGAKAAAEMPMTVHGPTAKKAAARASTAKGESPTEARRRAEAIAALLRERYPVAECALHYEGDPWRLLVMGRLSAQCTDARVNEVAVPLFARYPNAAAMAEADPDELSAIVRPCGLFRTKARDLILASRRLLLVYGGRLPDTMDELLTLAGVGRKIANLLLGDVFGVSAVVADTHMIRLSGRWGFTPEGKRDPLLVEKTLTPLLSNENASDFCHRAVLFGREVCTARAPACGACELGRAGLCRFSERSRYE